MRVLWDGYWLKNGPPSGVRVVEGMIPAWRAEFPGDTLTIGVSVADPPAWLRADRDLRTVRLRLPLHAVAVSVELALHAARRRYDLVITQNYAPVIARTPTAVVIHDMTFQAHPEWFTKAERCYLAPIPWLATRAGMVATDSTTEAKRIVTLNPRLAGKTTAIGLGIDESLLDAVPVPTALSARSFYLVVGRLNVRKNLAAAFQALKRNGLLSPASPLVVVGIGNGRQGLSDEIADAVGSGVVKLLGAVDDGQLRWLYENCRLFLFPSLDEGFGLPLIEARCFGAPIVLSDIAVFKELAPDLDPRLFFDPRDVASVGRAVTFAVESSSRPSPVPSVHTWRASVKRLHDAAVSL